MRDFEVTIRVRNNRIKERRLALGLTQGQLAQVSGVSIHVLRAYEGMYDTPLSRRGGWKTSARALATFFDTTPEALWPEAILAVKTSRATRHVDAAELHAFAGVVPALPSVASPEELYLDAVDVSHAREALDGFDFPSQQARAVRLRFGLDDGQERTLEEVAAIIGGSRENARQAIERGLRRLRTALAQREVKPVPAPARIERWAPRFATAEELDGAIERAGRVA